MPKLLTYGVVLTLLLVVGVVLYAVYVWQGVRRSIDLSVALIAKTSPYEQHPLAVGSRILVAGDSTAVGVGAEPAESIAGRLGKDFPQADITNIGVSGLRLEGLQALLEKHQGKYDLVVLQIGANDITGRTPYEVIRKNLDQVLVQAATLGTETLVLTAGNVGLSPVFRWPLGPYITARTRVVRTIFMEVVAKQPNAAYVDLFEEKEEDTFSTDIDRYYAPDYFHPSGDGYGVWYKKVRAKLDL